MVTINNITPQNTNTDKSSQIEYMVNFEGTNHTINGTLVATENEVSNAFKDIEDGDVFFGLKKLVLQKIQTEAANALK